MQLELDSADAECALDAARSEADHQAERRILDSMRLTPEQIEAVQQARQPQPVRSFRFLDVVVCHKSENESRTPFRTPPHTCPTVGRAGGYYEPSAGK